jgi:hypothetical protein
MKSIAKPGSFGYSRSATDERFTKNWLTDCAKQDLAPDCLRAMD